MRHIIKRQQNSCVVRSLKGAPELRGHLRGYHFLRLEIILRASEFLLHPSIRSWDTTKTIITKVTNFFFFRTCSTLQKRISAFRLYQNGVREKIFEELPTKTINLCSKKLFWKNTKYFGKRFILSYLGMLRVMDRNFIMIEAWWALFVAAVYIHIIKHLLLTTTLLQFLLGFVNTSKETLQ